MSDLIEPSIMRWEDPPKRARASGRVDWTPVAEALRERRGSWALVMEVTAKTDQASQRRLRSLAPSIRAGAITAFAPAGSFEAQTRMVGDRVRLYVRCVESE